MRFGKYAVVAPVEYRFRLEPDWYWKIKPPTSADELEVMQLVTAGIVYNDENGQRVIPPTWLDIAMREIAVTFGGTNIPKDPEKPVEEGGEPILPANAAVSDVENVLRQMPVEMIEEIWEAVGEAVPGWGPKKPESQKRSRKSSKSSKTT